MDGVVKQSHKYTSRDLNVKSYEKKISSASRNEGGGSDWKQWYQAQILPSKINILKRIKINFFKNQM